MRLQNRQRKLKVDRAVIGRLVDRVLEGERANGDAFVEVVLLRDPPVAELNRRYRNREGPTDVLSFPTDPVGWPREEPRPLGTVVVSVDRACKQASERGLAVHDEILRLVTHGILHLLGYDDGDARGRERMRRRENRYLTPPTRGEVTGALDG